MLTDVPLVRRLLADQFPAWADCELTAIPATGTDNLIYRLGPDLTVRMPRIEGAVDQVSVDHAWLRRIASHLPCVIATPVAVGEPGQGYPFPWAIHRWLDGANPPFGDHEELAGDLAEFVLALRALTHGPPSSRSGPLSLRDQVFREALAKLEGEVDVHRAEAVWEECVAAPEHEGPPVWRHADLTPGNLLVLDGRLSAVIDFGPSGLGDPAVDLMPFWKVFTGRSREVFRRAVDSDDAAWLRARGWTLSVAVLELAYYRRSSRALADGARAALREVLLP